MTAQPQQPNPVQKYSCPDDDIELIDYLCVVWKWKWVIIIGTFLCTLVVAIFGVTRPVATMYKVSALVDIDPESTNAIGKIKSSIEFGTFNTKILKELSGLQGVPKPKSLSFKATIPKGLNILSISYETPNADLGKVILNSLVKQLRQEYKEKIEQARTRFDKIIEEKIESIKGVQSDIQLTEKKFQAEIMNKENEIEMHAAAIKGLKKEIRHVKNRINQMGKTLQHAQLNSKKMAAEANNILLNPQDNTGRTEIFMQIAAIQDIINYPIALGTEFDSLVFKEKDFSGNILSENSKIKELEAEIPVLKLEHKSTIQNKENAILTLKSEIESLKRDRDQVTGFVVRQPPAGSLLPIKSKTKRNILLAGTAGFFFLVFLAFFIEYIKNASKHTHKTI